MSSSPALPPIRLAMSWLDWATLVGLSMLWGSSFFMVEVANDFVPPFTLVAGRVCFGALALHVLVRAAGQRLPTNPRLLLTFLGIGAVNNALPFSLIVWGQTEIASGLASILNATTPLFTVVVAHVMTSDERMTVSRVGGVLVGFAGVVVLVGPDALAGLGSALLAQFAVLGAALCYALATVFGRRFRRLGIPPLVSATGQVTAAALLILPTALVIDRPWTLPVPSGSAVAAVVSLGVLSTAVAYILYYRLLGTVGATNLMLVTFLVPVTAISLGTLGLGEQLGLADLAGMALIAAGLAAIDGRVVRALRR